MSSNNLGRTTLSASQAQKTTNINNQTAILDGAISDTFEHTDTSSFTVTDEEFREHVAHKLTGSASGALTMTVPDGIIRGLFIVVNQTGQTVTVEAAAQTETSPTVDDGDIGLFYADGSDVFFISSVSGSGGGGGGIDGIVVEEDGVETATDVTTLDFNGSDFNTTDDGSGQVSVQWAGLSVEDDNSSVGSAKTLNFDGTAVASVTDDGGGQITVTINQSAGSGGGVDVEEGGSSVLAGATTLDFAAADFDVTDDGSDQAGVAWAGFTVEERGSSTVTGAKTLDFDGPAVEVTDDGSGQAGVEIGGGTQINEQTGTSYTLALADKGKIVEMNNGSANTLTIPTNASVAFPVGSVVNIAQTGSGTTTITGDTGVTVNGVSGGSGDMSGQYTVAFAYKTGTDEWIVSGSVGAIS